MARRSQIFKMMPWVGGVNTSVDPGVLNPQQLVRADNVVFSASGSRLKREGFDYLESGVPAPTHKSSSGGVRTLKFAANALVTTSPSDHKLTVGERINVTGDASYNIGDAEVLSITDIGGGIHELTYLGAASLTESETATSTIRISRANPIIDVIDYWRYDGAGGNTQLLIAVNNLGQVFSIDNSGRRNRFYGELQRTLITTAAASTITTGDYFLISAGNDETSYYVWYNKDAGGGDPGLGSATGIEVVITGSMTADQVAAATQAELDVLADFTATVAANVITVECQAEGRATGSVDVNTGFTITTSIYGATKPLTALTSVKHVVFNERVILFFSGLNNLPVVLNPDENSRYRLLSPDAPDASFGFVHQARIWCNDKVEKDRIHYSESFDETVWMGFGDSGAMLVGPGDADPEGIVNGYSYKEFIVVGKKTSRYRISGYSPEEYQIELISSGLGNEGPLSIAVDETDVVFVSRRGVHSQTATSNYGDTDAAYLSAQIQPTFKSWSSEDLKNMQGTFIPELNSIALSVTEQGRNSPNAIWLYNIENNVEGSRGAWYRWPEIDCSSLSRRYVNGRYKIVAGTSDGRIIQAQSERNYTDFDTTGIPFNIKTGTIYPDGNPQSLKAFHSIGLIYRPKGNFSFTVKTFIDNFPAQSFTFNQVSGLDLLGESFILGQSLLGSSNTLAPYTYTMDGIGRGITLEITQPSADEQVEIWGLILEYSPTDIEYEVKT